MARAFGVYRHDDGFRERAPFVLDSSGSIYSSYVSPIDVNPGAYGILHALEDMAATRASA